MLVVFSLVIFHGDEFKTKWTEGGEKQLKKVNILKGTTMTILSTLFSSKI